MPAHEHHERRLRGDTLEALKTDQTHGHLRRARRGWATSMCNAFDDTDERISDFPSDHLVTEEEDALGIKDVKISNPWTMAKMNASITPKRSAPLLDQARYGLQLLTPGESRPEQPSNQNPRSTGIRALHQSITALATPEPSSPFKSTSNIVSSSPIVSSLPLNPGTHRQRLFHHNRPTETLDSTPAHRDSAGDRPGVRKPWSDFVPATALQTGTPLDAIPVISQEPRNAGQRHKQKHSFVNGPFVPPMTHSEQFLSQASTLRQAESTWKKSTGLPLSTGKRGPNDLPRTMDPDLAFTMDYERRKQSAAQERSKTLRQQTLDVASRINVGNEPSSPAPRSSPHKNRYVQAVSALRPQTFLPRSQPPVFEADDPRSYLIHLQTLEAAETKTGSGPLPKVKRRKTANLPLESVRPEDMLHELKTTVKMAEQEVVRRVTLLARYDEYIKPQEAEEEDLRAETRRWEEMIRRLLKSKCPGQEKYIDDVSIDLIAILQQ